MSGRTKTIIYRIFEGFCLISALAGVFFMICSALSSAEPKGEVVSFTVAVCCALAVLLLFPVPVVVHEGGHLLCGFLAGMRFSSVSVGRIRITRNGVRLTKGTPFAGATEMFPKNGERVRGRAICFTLGGAVLNLVYGVVFLALYGILTVTPALLFFQLFAPLSLAEGLIALYPAELSAGKTDGGFALAIAGNKPEGVAALHVFQAQGILSGGSFSSVPESLLFDVPVIREDDPAFAALTQLRWQYLLDHGDTQAALKELSRLETLLEYLPEELCAEVFCDLAYAHAALISDFESAENYLSRAKGSESCAYFRARAAIYGESEEGGKAFAKAYELAEKLPMKGMREFEKNLLLACSPREQ